MAITVSGLYKTFGRTEVLHDVSIEVPNGSVAGLQGINGSGKTLIMRAVCGLLRPSAGKVIVDGVELGVKGDFPPSLGMMIEGPAFLDDRSGFKNLQLIACVRGIASKGDVRCALERVGLDPELRKRYRAYSLGMKQRLGIAAAIMEAPQTIVLDEPTNALDVDGIALLYRILAEERRRGAAILVSSHDRAILDECCDVVYAVSQGRITGKEEAHV